MIRPGTLAGYVRMGRLRCGWTQVELAQRTRLAQSTIGAVESGHLCWPETVTKLCAALNLDPAVGYSLLVAQAKAERRSRRDPTRGWPD